jgi:hypothetical protein
VDNLRRWSPYAESVELLAADSLSLNSAALADIFEKFGGFRLFSVDGGHTREHAYSDLLAAQELLAPGGIVLLDDFFQQNWPEVTEGVARYFATATVKLAPVCIAGSKLFLTTLSHYGSCLEHVQRGLKAGWPTSSLKMVRLFGWPCASFILKPGAARLVLSDAQ